MALAYPAGDEQNRCAAHRQQCAQQANRDCADDHAHRFHQRGRGLQRCRDRLVRLRSGDHRRRPIVRARATRHRVDPILQIVRVMRLQWQSRNRLVRTGSQLVVRVVIPQRHIRVAGLVRGFGQQPCALFDRHGRVFDTVIDEQRHGERCAVFGRVEIRVGESHALRAKTGDARNELLDGVGRARGGQIVGGGERHLLAARDDRGRGEDGEGEVRMLLCQHGGDPRAFRFGVDAGSRPAHAWPVSQDFQRFRIVARAGHVVAVQHRVVVEPLVGHEGGDASRRHRVRHVAERLRRFAGTRAVQEQACGTVCRRVERLADDGVHGFATVQRDRDMRFLGAVRAFLRGFEHGARGRVDGLDGGAGRSGRDMVRERLDLPFRRHRIAERA